MISRTANVGAGLGDGLKSKPKLHWKDFKAERYESKRDETKYIEQIAIENYDKHVNLANYIQEEP